MVRGYYSWWACDYFPVSGWLRILIYGLLLWMWQSGWGRWITGTIANCPNSLFEPAGVMGWLVAAGISPALLSRTALAMQPALVFVWLCAVVGLFGRWPRLLTGLGVAVVWGVFQSSAGTGHNWHLPMYLLLVCGIFLRSDRCSLDGLLSRWWPAWPFNPDHGSGPDLSGFARKLILLLAVFTLFAAGVAKLVHGGIAWMDGKPLLYYLGNLNDPKMSFGFWLHGFLMVHPSAVTALSVGTIILELGSIVTLFSARTRWPFFLCAWAFHLGIWFLMIPRYWPQMACYLLLVPWEALRVNSAAELLQVLSGWKKPPPAPKACLPGAAVQTGLSLLVTGICLALVATMVVQREWFPLTHVPMYSSYVSQQRLGEFPKTDYGDLAALARIAAVADNDGQPWWIKFEIERKTRLIGRSAQASSGVALDGFPGNVVDKYLWTRRISYALLDDLREGSQPANAAFRDCQRKLDAIEGRIFGKHEWMTFDEFTLVFLENDGSQRALASIRRPN